MNPRSTNKGRFTPKNPQKYIGKITNIFFRSSWELRIMRFFDSNPSVLKWCSEEFSIPYRKPTDGKIHNYFPDFFVIFNEKDGSQRKMVLEIKPLKETVVLEGARPQDKLAFIINQAKWQAASAFCAARGIEFKVMTEVEIFGGKAPRQKRTKKK